MTEQTQPFAIGETIIGYMLNTGLAPEAITKVQAIQERFRQQFGQAVWLAPPETLHITLFDWIAPLVDYGQDKDALFAGNQEMYDRALQAALTAVEPIPVKFTTVAAFPAAIIIQGSDSGQYQRIREACRPTIELLPGTKPPPTIIHTTIGRFVETVDLTPVQQLASSLTCDIDHTTSEFRLVRETKDPLVEFSVLKRYRLGAAHL
jgi:2'-5' RNA ligase